MATDGSEPKLPVLPLVQALKGWETQQRGFWFISTGCFQLPAPRADSQPRCSRALARSGSCSRPWLGAQSPLPQSGSQAPRRQPTGTPVHAANGWINTYNLMSPLSPAEREENGEKSKHSEYPPAARPPTAVPAPPAPLTITAASLGPPCRSSSFPGDTLLGPPTSSRHVSISAPRPGETQNNEAQPQLLLIHTFMAANS